MAYGVEFINDYGENVLRSSGLFFEKASGTLEWTPHWDSTKMPTPSTGQFSRYTVSTLVSGPNNNHEWALAGDTSGNASSVLYYQNFSGTTDLGSWNKGANGRGAPWDSRLIQWSADWTDGSLASSSVPLGSHYPNMPKAIPNTVGSTVSSFYDVFFKMNTNGLHHFGSYYNPYAAMNTSAAQGVVAWCQGWWQDGDGQEYKVVGTPVPSVSGNYGINVKDASNNTIYDSRYVEKAIRIKDHIYVSKSDMDDVIQNNATKLYPLRSNISNPWIGGDTSSSAKREYGYGTTWWFPRFQIVSINGVDNLKITCTRYRFKSGSASTAFPHYHTNSGTYLIADI